MMLVYKSKCYEAHEADFALHLDLPAINIKILELMPLVILKP